MKAKFTFLFALLVAFGSLSAQQVPNAGFENWNDSVPSYPIGWDSYDHLIKWVSSGTLPQKGWCTKDTAAANVHAGTASARLKTDTTAPPIGLVHGSVILGKIGFDGAEPVINGAAFTGRPFSASAFLKVSTAGGTTDTFGHQILLTKWDATGDSSVVVGYAFYDIYAAGNAAGTVVDTITYLNNLTPDTLIMVYSSGEHVGSILWVDDLSFTYAATGVVHFDMDDAVKVFPNPVSSQLNIVVDDYMTGYSFEAYDLAGRLAKRAIIERATYSMDVADLAGGLYVYHLRDTDGKMVHQGKFEVAK